ncbi:MAG TPA: alcohol dehydrogenase catalytic domain-containing protein [Acidimicrobiales bacterium]|nr:alcohol dehydrogenase catalytic domain-containing protein [Acidimicrobiales bacterium]
MPAAVYKGNRTIVVEEIPVPQLGASQVLLEVSHCGICGTDLHMVMEGWGRTGSTGGHEYSGVVSKLGSGVTGWAEGDRVVGGPRPGCGRCANCRAGNGNLCRNRPRSGMEPFVGAFARYKAVEADALFAVPSGLDLRTAALTEPLAVALRGVRRTDAQPGDRVLVTGAGPIGLLTVALLSARGVTDVVVSEPGRKRRERALELGAAAVIAPGELERPAMPMEVVTEPYRLAFECSGRVEAMEAALDNLDRAGTLMLSGAGMERPRFDSNRIILNELVVTGTYEYTREDYELAMDLLTSKRLPEGLLIEPGDQPLDRLQWAMEQLVAGELAGKVLVAPGA